MMQDYDGVHFGWREIWDENGRQRDEVYTQSGPKKKGELLYSQRKIHTRPPMAIIHEAALPPFIIHATTTKQQQQQQQQQKTIEWQPPCRMNQSNEEKQPIKPDCSYQ
jgi:hypothetical protein